MCLYFDAIHTNTNKLTDIIIQETCQRNSSKHMPVPSPAYPMEVQNQVSYIQAYDLWCSIQELKHIQQGSLIIFPFFFLSQNHHRLINVYYLNCHYSPSFTCSSCLLLLILVLGNFQFISLSSISINDAGNKMQYYI